MSAISRLREVYEQLEYLAQGNDPRFQDLPMILEDLRILKAEIGDARPGALAFTVEINGFDDEVYVTCPIEPCAWETSNMAGRTLAELLGEAQQHLEDEHR